MDISDTTPISVDVVVRPFRAEDLPQVVEVFKAGMRSYAPFRVMPEQVKAYFQECLNGDLSDTQGTYITLEAISGLQRPSQNQQRL